MAVSLVILQIVDRVELRAENLVALVQVMQVGTAEILAGITIAGLINGQGTGFMSGVA